MQQNRNFIERGIKAVHPLLALSVFPAAACCNIAINFGIHGPTVSNSNSCAAGAVAREPGRVGADRPHVCPPLAESRQRRVELDEMADARHAARAREQHRVLARL